MIGASSLQVREHPRFARRRPVVVHVAGAGACRYGALEIVGRGGVELRCERSLSPDDVVDLEICLSGAVIRTPARVVTCRGAPGEYLIGLQYLGLPADAETLLAALLEDRD